MTQSYAPVSRVAGDQTPITFSWSSADATITGTRSIDGAAAAAIVGEIEFSQTASGKHFFRIAYSAADRPAAAGSVLFTLTDGTTTRLLPLVVHDDCDDESEVDPEDPAPLLDPDNIGEAMAGPASMTVDGNTFVQHNLKDQIAADKYRRALLADEQPLSKRLRFGRFVPPGTT